jgi:ribosomal protein S18 acetylase RimI-like enzyme
MVGFISGYVGRFRDGAMRSDVHDTVSLARAWVDPRVRRTGVGRALADAVKTWALERNAAVLETQVTENNDPAIHFYIGLGFADTGRREPLLSNPALQIHFLSQPL